MFVVVGDQDGMPLWPNTVNAIGVAKEVFGEK